MNKEIDNKYDQSFRNSELGVKKENETDNYEQENLNAYYDEQKRMEEHFTKEADDFGGQHYI